MEFKVTSRKFWCQLINGDTYALDTSDFASNLTAAPLERIQVETTLTMEVISTADAVDTFTITLNTVLTRILTYWEDDGWKVGDTFACASPVFTATITALDGYVMTFTVNSGTATNGAATILTITSDFLAAEYKFNLIENSAGPNFVNSVDGSIQSYSIPAITGAYQTMTPSPGAKSWQTGDVQIKRTSLTAGIATYVILQEFVNIADLSAYRDYILSGVQPEDYNGDKGLKHIFNIKLRKLLSDPNIQHEHTDSDNLGASKWFSEGTNYTCTLTGYTDVDSGDVVTAIQVTKRTRVTGQIASSALFSASNYLGAYVQLIVPPYLAHANNTLYKTLHGYDNAVKQVGTTNTPTGVIKRLTSVLTSSSIIDFSFDVELSAAQQAAVYSNKAFNITEILLLIQTGNPATATTLSDKDMLPLAVSTMVIDTDVVDLLYLEDSGFRRHDQDDGDPLYTSVAGRIGEGFIYETTLVTVLSAETYIQSITGRLIVEDCHGNELVELARYPVDLSGAQLVNAGLHDKQAIEMETEAGLLLPEGDEFNVISINEKVDAAAIRHGEWTITADDVDEDDFYDGAFTTAFSSGDIDVVFADITGSGFDYSDDCTDGITIHANGVLIKSLTQPATLAYIAKNQEVVTGLRMGTVVLTAGVNVIKFDSTLGATTYALVISDLAGAGIGAPTKANDGFTITADAAGKLSYSALLHSSTGIYRAGSQAITVGANAVTFPTYADDLFTVIAKDHDNIGNITDIAKFADGFTFNALAAGTLNYQTFYNS